jgi:hypothetical protein
MNRIYPINKYVHDSPQNCRHRIRLNTVCVSLSVREREVSRARFERTKGVCLPSFVLFKTWIGCPSILLPRPILAKPSVPMSKFPRQEDFGKSQRYRLSQYRTCSDMPFGDWKGVSCPGSSAKVPPKRLKSSRNSLLVMLGSFPG